MTDAVPITRLKISEPLTRLPTSIFDHADSLEHLDLSGTGLSALPDDFSRLKKLKVAFFSDCHFSVFPSQLASCPELEMVAFRGNNMSTVPEDSLPPRLRWLILTNNQIVALPKSIGKCWRLQKCMLSGNRLTSLPEEMASCKKLGLLRLSANNFEQLPAWLFDLPELAFLSFAGNPCSTATTPISECQAASFGLMEASWSDLDVQETLGEGASGIISKGVWNGADRSSLVAIKLFKGDVTSDGTPLDEMQACMTAGPHENLIDPLGKIRDHPDCREGLVMQLVPPSYTTLGLPPSLQSCTRDCFPTSSSAELTTMQGLRILRGVASAAAHLHQRGVAHGDLYAHNILFNEEGHALLGDFGAASVYDHHHYGGQGQHSENDGSNSSSKLEQLEVLAFAHLIEDVWRLTPRPNFDEGELRVAMLLAGLHRRCASPLGTERPRFADIHRSLSELLLDLDPDRQVGCDGGGLETTAVMMTATTIKSAA
ncbi:serine/threonine protein kinase [Biscogniauxia mediterranea]|nr:serine/threonine protein kinase [Biscogniauxia mediterranea]